MYSVGKGAACTTPLLRHHPALRGEDALRESGMAPRQELAGPEETRITLGMHLGPETPRAARRDGGSPRVSKHRPVPQVWWWWGTAQRAGHGCQPCEPSLAGSGLLAGPSATGICHNSLLLASHTGTSSDTARATASGPPELCGRVSGLPPSPSLPPPPPPPPA